MKNVSFAQYLIANILFLLKFLVTVIMLKNNVFVN